MEVSITIQSAAVWRKAVNCTLLADRTTDDIARKTLTLIRNSWIEVANDSEVLGTNGPGGGFTDPGRIDARSGPDGRLSPPEGDGSAMATARRRTCHKRSRASRWLPSNGWA
jgi:hypothetical protein